MAITTTTPTGLTVDDLEAMPDDGRRYELIDGAIVMTPAPEVTHQRISYRLQRLLADAAGPGWEVFAAPTDLDLPGGNRVEPDLIVVEAGRTGPRLSLPVVLVLEIVSGGSRTHDRVTKRAAYAEAGLPAYWLFDTLRATVTCLRLAGDAYEPYAEGPVVEVDWPVAVRVDLEALATPKVPIPEG
jgi:Uma2 family endonuclease